MATNVCYYIKGKDYGNGTRRNTTDNYVERYFLFEGGLTWDDSVFNVFQFLESGVYRIEIELRFK